MTPPETSCPHCGKTQDSGTAAAPNCPYCGRPLSGPGPGLEQDGATAGAGTSAPRRVRSLALGGGAVVVIVIARIAIFASLRDTLSQAWMAAGGGAKAASATAARSPAKATGAVRDAPDVGEVRTRLVVLRGGGTRPVVALARPTGPKSVDIIALAKQPTLYRELVRQAMLIAARDELGLPTRDEVLDDVSPGKGEGAPVELSSVFRGNGSWAVVRRGEPGTAETLVKLDLGRQPDHMDYSGKLATMAEAHSRLEFPGVLRRLGLEGKPNKVRDEAPVPADVEGRLEGLGLVDHFAAVRALHDAMRADGESPARLAAMARAYAQLGVLTEYQWSPAHRAFKARAMLYAERLLARAPKSPQALWSRAFVRALVGFHAEALADIAEGRNQAGRIAHAAPPPSWLPVIEAYIKNDLQRLDVKDGPHVKLAALLRMFDREYPEYTRAAVLAARDVLDVDAGCYRAYDVICNSGQLGDKHKATVMGPEAFTQLFPVKLKSLTSLPASVRQPLDKDRDELTLFGALDKAGQPGGDDGEPSWGVLAHLAREVRFAQAWRRMTFMVHGWSVPPGDYWADVQPFVARHRYAPYLESLTLPPQEARAVMAKLADGFDPIDLEVNQKDLFHRFDEFQLPVPDRLWGFHTSHCESGAGDFSAILSRTGANPLRVNTARCLLATSPYSAYGMAGLVVEDWNKAEREVGAWRQKVHDAPALLDALAKKYAELKRYEDAEKCLIRYIEQSPDRPAFELLAQCYLARGDRDRWRSTLEDYLARTEDAGLEHARNRVELANYLMMRERWADAKKYAEPAAETWAQWAMLCASRCNEGLEDWERAELWIRRTAERYPTSNWAAWYLFCRRTGHGDVEAARAMAEEYLAAVEGRPDLADPHQVGLFYWATGSPKKALENLEKAEAAQPTPVHAFAAMLVADELGDKARRERMLAEFCTRFQDKVPRTVSLARMIREAHTDGGEHPLDLAAVDKVLGRMPANTRGNAEFLIGRYLLDRGQAEAARKYLQDAANAPETYVWLKVIAADSLRAMDAKKGR